jgi:hypothetical protein
MLAACIKDTGFQLERRTSSAATTASAITIPSIVNRSKIMTFLRAYHSLKHIDQDTRREKQTPCRPARAGNQLNLLKIIMDGNRAARSTALMWC